MRSVLRSPLRSAVLTTFQAGSASSSALLTAPVPFINQATVFPCAGSFHKRSDIPSPFKSGNVVIPIWAFAESGNANRTNTAIDADKYQIDLDTNLNWNTPHLH